MADNTKIEWTDATLNVVTGCVEVSPGCKNCYARRDWNRLSANPKTIYFGREFHDIQVHPERLDQVIRWTKPRKVFVNSMSDLFHTDVPEEFIDRVFAAMARARHHIYQVLTKRPERMAQYLNAKDRKYKILAASHGLGWAAMEDMPWPLPHVWIGVSVENQAAADIRIPALLRATAAVRWISAEPLLGPVDLDRVYLSTDLARWIDWVVVGGESGPKARPMHPAWAQSLRDQCAGAGVPYLFKQWGEWEISSRANGHFDCDMARNGAYWVEVDGSMHSPSSKGLIDPIAMVRVGKKKAGRLLDGIEHNGYPEVRE